MSYAGFFTRLMSHNIDLLFYLFFAMILRMIFSEPLHMYLLLIAAILTFEIAFVSSRLSATPGRRYMKIKVLDCYENRLSVYRVIVRTLLKPISLIFLFVGFAMIVIRKDKRSLHDLVAGSIVVFKIDG